MPTQSQKNSEQLNELDKKVALIESDLKSIKDNHLHTIQEAMKKIEKHIGSMWKVLVAYGILFALIASDKIAILIDLIT
tara:strand:- start:72 stop:308 length:237 start_codon:yes stop_codon:yes gene_type:complete